MRVIVERGSGEVGSQVGLDDDEVHHLKVRRARAGEQVEILDGMGLIGTGTLVQVGRDWMVQVSSAELQQRPPALALAVATGDRERFSWLVEKSVELGVTRIVPLQTKRTADVATRLKDTHVARLRRSALEATKQCGLAWSPMIQSPMPLSDFLTQRTEIGWLADQQGAPAPASLDSMETTVIVGPEGGLTEDEREAVIAAGYRPVALGRYTLRFETAALAAAAAITQGRMRR